MLKSRIKESEEVDITPMIDIVFQLIIFFMVVMAIAVVYGVAIKFPPPGRGQQNKQKEEKNIFVHIGADRITKNHLILKDGVLKVNGEEIPWTRTDLPPAKDKARWQQVYAQWEEEREQALDEVQRRMEHLIREKGYKTDILLIQGDMKTYHGKIMRVIDRGKRVRTGKKVEDPRTGNMKEKIGIDGFSLVPPRR